MNTKQYVCKSVFNHDLYNYYRSIMSQGIKKTKSSILNLLGIKYSSNKLNLKNEVWSV